MKKKVLAFMLITILVLAIFSGCGSKDTKTELVNTLGVEITAIYVCPENSEVQGPFLNESLISGATTTLNIIGGKGYELFTLSVVDSEGVEYYFEQLTIENGSTIMLTYEGAEIVAFVTTSGSTSSHLGNKVVPIPSADDPLNCSAALLNFPGGLEIPYPSTMKAKDRADRQMNIDAINDNAPPNCITFSMIELNYSSARFANAASAENALVEIKGKLAANYAECFVAEYGYDFIDAGNYYGLRWYFELTPASLDPAPEHNVRVIMELRYFGATGYLMHFDTYAYESDMDNYYAIAKRIADNINFGAGYVTSSPVNNSGGQSYVDEEYYEPNDYDPWSDPGDYGYEGDDEYYEPNDYDPWSDPGDYGYDY